MVVHFILSFANSLKMYLVMEFYFSLFHLCCCCYYSTCTCLTWWIHLKSNVWHGPSSMMSNNANSRKKKLDHSFTKNKDTKNNNNNKNRTVKKSTHKSNKILPEHFVIVPLIWISWIKLDSMELVFLDVVAIWG